MTYYEHTLTSHLKKYDPDLYASKNRDGVSCVFKKSRRYNEYEFEGQSMLCFEDSPQYIMALTEDWSPMSKPVYWGIDRVLQRIWKIDSRNTNVMEELEAQDLALEKSHNKHVQNEAEAYLSDYHSEFKKAFSDINTASMAKVDNRRKKEKRIKER